MYRWYVPTTLLFSFLCVWKRRVINTPFYQMGTKFCRSVRDSEEEGGIALHHTQDMRRGGFNNPTRLVAHTSTYRTLFLLLFFLFKSPLKPSQLPTKHRQEEQFYFTFARTKNKKIHAKNSKKMNEYIELRQQLQLWPVNL